MFCKNCNNILEISKSDLKTPSNDITPSELSDSNSIINYDDIIEKIENNIEISKELISEIDFITLQNSSKLKKKSNKNRTKIKEKILELIGIKENSTDNIKAYYVCKNCFYSKPINNGELILSRMNINNTLSNTIYTNKYKNKLQSSILPRTNKYICKNSKCKTHNGFQKEAIFFREYNSTRTWYVCSVCITKWRI